MTDKALVILSGGQDSTTCLFWALQQFGSSNIRAISFDYGQRHAIELASAAKVAELAAVPHEQHRLDIFQQLASSSAGNRNALLDSEQAIEAPKDALPNTFVAGRNLFFLTYGAAYAYGLGIQHLVTGVAQTDYSGYPDCREETLKAVEQSISLGMDYPFTIHTPLMHLSKAETVEMAAKVGALEAMAWTHTCYEGQFPPCGKCPACQLRARGFECAGIADPLVQRAQSETGSSRV